jgi:hypothetical protein
MARLALTLGRFHHHRGQKARPATATEAEEFDFGWELSEGADEDEIEQRATELAQDKLREGVKSAVEMTREEFDRKLKEAVAEKDYEWSRKFAQLTQRQLAASAIEAAGFKTATERALKEEFHDAYFEDKRDKNGAVLKAGEDVCREAVKARIKAKRDELREFTGTRISEAGETADSLRTGDERTSSGEELPARAPLDEKVDKALAIPASAGKR